MEQLHRAQRYLDRIREMYAGTPYRFRGVENYEDDVISFFIHCHHISDWLLEHYPGRVSKAEINTYINTHEELKVCADFVNGKKHCILKRSRSGFQPAIGKRGWMIVTYKREIKKPIIFFGRYEVVHGSMSSDALQLAEKCMTLWRDFVRKKALSAI